MSGGTLALGFIAGLLTAYISVMIGLAVVTAGRPSEEETK